MGACDASRACALKPAAAAAPSLAGRLFTWAGVAVLVLIGLWVAVTAQRELRADLTAAPARFSAQRWAEGVSQPASRAQWEAVVAELEEALEIQPKDPALHEVTGNALTVGTLQSWITPNERPALLARAEKHFRQSLALRPADGMTWALLASTLARAGNFGPDLQASSNKALALGPNEAHVQQVLMMTTLQHWDKVPHSLQQWASDLFEQGTQDERDAINRLAALYDMELASDQPPRATNATAKGGQQ